MTNNSEQPEWDLLPANPQDFFALHEEFDRKDLKRAYNRLIRIYKPEKHPAEFQLIRAAFEQLDLQLRYGYSQSIDSQVTTDYSWVDLTEMRDRATTSVSRGGTAEQRAPLELHERLDQESPQALFQELAQKLEKDPYDFYALALLADVVDRKDSYQFARWLLKGLEAYPQDHGLLQLMRDYLRELEVTPMLAKLLIASSKAVPNDNFYPLTEAAWENLLRQEPFEFCINTLKQCQANLRGIDITGQLAFTIRVLRFALWRDQSDWKDKAIDFVEENFEQIPGHLEFELEILSAAHQYIATRDKFLNGDSLRQRIDQAMESYFTLDQVEGDRHVLQCQLHILDSSEELLNTFPPDGSEECQAMYTLWDWLSGDVAERFGAELQDDINVEVWVTRCSALLKQCRTRTEGSAGGWRWQLAGIVMTVSTHSLYLVIPILLCFLLMAIALALFPPDGGPAPVWIVVFGLSIGGGVYAARKLSAIVANRLWQPYCEREARRNYLRHWRREVLDFLNRSQLPFHTMTRMLAHVMREDYDTWVCHFSQQDYGLAMYGTARRFLA